MDIRILKDAASSDHVHIEYPPRLSVSDILKKLKGRISSLLQKDFLILKEDIGDSTFGHLVTERGVQVISQKSW